MHSIYSSATTLHATIRGHKLRERFHDNPPQGSQRRQKKAALVHRKRYTVVANRSPGRYLSNQNLCGIEVLRARAHTHFALPGSNAMMVVPFTRNFYMVRARSLCRKWFHDRRAMRPQNSHSSCSVVQFALFSSFGGKCTRIATVTGSYIWRIMRASRIRAHTFDDCISCDRFCAANESCVCVVFAKILIRSCHFSQALFHIAMLLVRCAKGSGALLRIV